VGELKRSKYRLLGLVGQGQFGRVYCAVHRKTGQLFALKALDKARFPTHQFLRELRFLLSLRHPNIVTCYALEHTPTGRYLVMDYCEGGTLRGVMGDEVCLHPAQALKLVVDVLAGLAHAHRKGIVHCDVKPENVLLHLQAEGWTARITDFGIARLSQEIASDGTGNTGSPAYMAPERFYGQHSPASDIYSVGILLFELLTGDRPFSGAPADLMAAHLNQPVQLPESVPAALKPIILTALQKLPARRFHSALEMQRAIQQAAATLDASLDPAWEAETVLKAPTPPTKTSFTSLHQEALEQEVRQLVALSIPGKMDSEPNTIGGSTIAGDRIYRVAGNRLTCQIYPDGMLSDDPGLLTLGRQFPLIQVRSPEPMREILLRPQGCFAIAQRSVYLIPTHLLQPSIPSPGKKTSQADSPDPTTGQTAPLLIAKFSQDFLATIDPRGHWMATTTLDGNKTSQSIVFWHLPPSPPREPHYPVRSITQSTYPTRRLFQLQGLDSRHLATFSHLVDPATGVCITGVWLQLWTRRGTAVGELRLPIPLRLVLPAIQPYRLLALEPGYPTCALLIDLKPIRILRVCVGIAPTLMATANWGYVLMDASGQIVLLNLYGDPLGQIQGPAHPTAIALLPPYALLIATWHNEHGCLHTVDLRQLDLDIVF